MIRSKRKTLLLAYAVALSVFMGALAIVVRVVYVQSAKKVEYAKYLDKNFIVKHTVQAERGDLYASDGTLLAMTVPRYTIHLDLTVVRNKLFEKQIDSLSILLGKHFEKPKKYFKNKLSKARQTKNQYLLLVKGVDYETYATLKSFPIFRKGRARGGFMVTTKPIRDMIINEFGDRLIGFDDDRGKAGLEGAYSALIKGRDGFRRMQKMKKGVYKPLSDDNVVEPIDGSDIITTFDLDIQDAAYNGLLKALTRTEAKHGSVVVMEVKTGRIKAMVNLTKTKEGYKDTRNWAIYEAVEPGSTFKLISLMAALEDGKVRPNTKIHVGNGVKKIYGQYVIDDHKNLGTIPLTDVLVHSSNVGTVNVIFNNYKKNPKAYVDRLYQWGLNEKLGLAIQGEGIPHIPYPTDKDWSAISLPWMAWGYGVKLTSLQMLTFYNAVANNGKMVKPQFVQEVRSDKEIRKYDEPEVLKPSICSQRTINQVKKMLKAVVERGTAKGIYTPEFSMAGKTGTTQVDYWKKGKLQYNASFAGFFPADNPKYSCIVVVNKPNKKIPNSIYGGSTAAPVFKAIARRVFINTPRILDTTKIKKTKNLFKKINQDNELIPNSNKKIPQLIGKNLFEAISTLENMGLKVNYSGEGSVRSQSLLKGYKFKKGQTIILKATL